MMTVYSIVFEKAGPCKVPRSIFMSVMSSLGIVGKLVKCLQNTDATGGDYNAKPPVDELAPYETLILSLSLYYNTGLGSVLGYSRTSNTSNIKDRE